LQEFEGCSLAIFRELVSPELQLYMHNIIRNASLKEIDQFKTLWSNNFAKYLQYSQFSYSKKIPVSKNAMKLNDKLLLLESKRMPFNIRPKIVCPSKPATLSTAKKTCKTNKLVARDFLFLQICFKKFKRRKLTLQERKKISERPISFWKRACFLSTVPLRTL